MATRDARPTTLTSLAMTLLLLSAGCTSVSPDSLDALADATRQLRDDHAAALVQDGGPRSLVTGQALIATLDAGFAE